MRVSLAALIVFFALISAHAQNVPNRNGAGSSPAVVRIRALQNQIERQQIEIDALRLRLGRLQQEFQELTEMIADQNAGSDDDDDATDDAQVMSLRVHGRMRRANQGAHPMSAVWTNAKQMSKPQWVY